MDDLALPQHHRSGAHRARRHPLLVLLVTLGTVGLASAVLLWGLLTLDVLGVGDELRRAGGASSAAPVDPTVAATTAAPAAAPTAAAPSVLPTTEPGASVEPSEEPEQVVDRSAPLDVLNSTVTVGLAAAAAAELQELGWTTGEVGNYPEGEIPTTVLYPEDSQQATAEAVADELGVGVVTASQDVDVVTVVLGPDYPA
ncbi:LytR C-terminal domain-containing protein [Aquipuribacter sp. MA13-6]|uniref:LytR C-terminal domain-containing protein n=1 Tax=unclassified Aquipuribacter TaxID=2635084 RepID=UPI003EEE60C3